MKKLRKKSQMEAFGLALIVILITIGFFIFIRIKAEDKKNQPNFKNDFVMDQTPTKFIYAVVEMHVNECTDYRNRQKISDLLKDCARLKNIKCSNKDSCTILNETLTKLANDTFGVKNMHYIISSKGLQNEIFIQNGDCTRGNGEMGESIISLYPAGSGEVALRMTFCNQ